MTKKAGQTEVEHYRSRSNYFRTLIADCFDLNGHFEPDEQTIHKMREVFKNIKHTSSPEPDPEDYATADEWEAIETKGAV